MSISIVEDTNNNNMRQVDVIVEIVGPTPERGSQLVFKDLDRPEPVLEFSDGSVYVGEFQEVVGTLMVFSETTTVVEGEQEEKTVVGLDSLNNKKLVFRKKT
jgi:hypothetical protein